MGAVLAGAISVALGQPAARDVMGQYVQENLDLPSFQQIGPNGGPTAHGFRFWARGVGSVLYRSKRPIGLSVDIQRRVLFVPDTYNHRVLVFGLPSEEGSWTPDAFLVLGQPDFQRGLSDSTAREDIDPPVPEPNRRNLLTPAATAWDETRARLFVADQGYHRVLIYDLARGFRSGMAAVHVLGQLEFTASSPNRGQAAGPFGLQDPSALKYDANRDFLWVADTGNHRVLAFDLSHGIEDGMGAKYLLGQADFAGNQPNRGGACSQETLFSPRGMAFTREGKCLFVADEMNNRVLGYDLGPGVELTKAATWVLGQSNFTANAPNHSQAGASAETLNRPHDLLMEASGERIMVADSRNARVLVYAWSQPRNGLAAVHSLGQPALDHAVPDGLPEATQATLNFPTGLATFGGRLLVTDLENNRIAVFDGKELVTGAKMREVLGQYHEGDVAQPAYTQQGQNDGPTRFEFDHSDGVSGCAIDARNHWLAVADALNGRVLFFQLDDSHRRKSRLAQNVLGVPDFETIGGKVVNQFTIRRPQRLLFDDRNRLWVADDQANRVLAFDLARGLTNGAPAAFVLGQTDFLGRDRAGGAAGLNRPRGLGYDPGRQRLFVADTDNHRIAVFDLQPGLTNHMSLSYVLGQPNATDHEPNQNGLPGVATLNFPRDPVYDSQNDRLMVADTFNQRVLVYELSAGLRNGMPATYVIGQPDFVTVAPVVARNRMDSVGSLAWDARREFLFVANRTGTRTLVFDFSHGITNGMDAVAVMGQPDFSSSSSLPGGEFAAGANIAYDPIAATLYAVDPNNDEHHLLEFPIALEAHPTSMTIAPCVPFRRLTFAGGLGPLNFRIVSGSLPDGLALDARSGLVSGLLSANVTGNFRCVIEGADVFGTTTNTTMELIVERDLLEIQASIQRLGPAWELKFPASGCRTYSVWRGTMPLGPYEAVATNLLFTSGHGSWAELREPSMPARFYRVSSP